MITQLSPALGWGLVALGCLGLEVLQGVSFVFIFFAAAAGATAATTALGWTPLFWQQTLVAAALAAGLLIGLRRRLLLWAKRSGVGRPGALGTPEGSVGLALDGADGGKRLRVELFGVAWQGRNVGTDEVAKGGRCRVVEVDGLCLNIVAEGDRQLR